MQWSLRASGLVNSALLVNNQVVGFLAGGNCALPPALPRWTSAILYSKILPSRDYIISTADGLVMVE